jgi:hypothetical protein
LDEGSLEEPSQTELLKRGLMQGALTAMRATNCLVSFSPENGRLLGREGAYGLADGPDSAGIDAVDALQGEDAAEEGCAHDEHTAAEEDADDEFSVLVSARIYLQVRK